jgi:hypothetical protein
MSFFSQSHRIENYIINSASMDLQGRSVGRSGKLLLALATVILGSDCRGTHDHSRVCHGSGSRAGASPGLLQSGSILPS